MVFQKGTSGNPAGRPPKNKININEFVDVETAKPREIKQAIINATMQGKITFQQAEKAMNLLLDADR